MQDWKRVLDQLDVAVVVQLPDLRIAYANPKATSLLGISSDEMTSRTVDDERWNVITPDGTQVVGNGHPGVRAVRHGEVVQGVLLGVRRGDSVERVWILASAVPEFDAEGRVLHAFVSFTDVNVAQRALREREATLGTVFASMSEGLAIHEPDGSIREVNAAAQRVLGLTLDQLQGRAATDPRWRLVKPDGAPVDADYIPSELAARSGVSVPARIMGVHRPNGELAWLSVRADPLREPGEERVRGVVAMFTDVTQQRETQLALETSRTHMQRVLDAVPGLVYQYRHPRHGPDRLDLVGGRVQEILGIAPTEVRTGADHVLLRVPEAERHALQRHIQETVARGEDFDYEVPFQHGSGELRRLRIHGVPETVDDGLLYTGVILDVTEEHRMGEALKRTQRREAMGDLAAGIAHNFNNMLAVILPNLEMAREEVPPAARELLDDASRAAVSASELVKRMLALGRPEPKDGVAVTDLAVVVREAMHFCRQTFDRTIRIDETIGVGTTTVRGTPTALQQVILNLCLNARDALAGVPRPELRITLTSDGTTVVLRVADNGRGMAPATLRRLGEPFFTTKAGGTGTGLGLATAFQTVSEAGGSWTVDSSPGAGAVFTIRFAAAAPVGSTPRNERPVPAGQSGAVLVVDDEPLVRDVLRRQLERAGYRAYTAASGPEALRLIESGEPGDLIAILLDLSMPEMSGAEALPLLRTRAGGAPVIVLSGHVDNTAALASASAILQKPVRNRDLLEAVESVRVRR